ncbi:PTS sugar transporter subunit IIA [Brachyspira hyodysenteriae]|uniref:PTS sugar transporter subunit IIA n=1 Tax=Brachyspira hyodysenteriae ATCC 27164 TaxID=1266923 RepID=A0A3B6VRI5_BRAHO|nr:PTS sugar transporter subunit IIA [Brachyspira hyodysenteriae]ANN63551.1 PTS sugar transporter subunit IIA [Brachyspira hyodysenteriae ATCC 27164]AUJ50095.1 PTS sugar transporter subunit IIA [Brachyspira hyodysenteriae]KLI18877.1 PTS sugar transporter subunit IIA [Brachyspira hyodysenteriae]KLI22104.1 PTS sugar transporter subunit IIA [Brachyspira hyodysenteriae]KLI27877.1 PTS sugar transporter subunit IIA [Brachyspira hyodysenteriae]
MKPNLILMSHGNLASTLIESAKMILGDLPDNDYDVIHLYTDNTFAQIENQLKTLLEKYEDNQILIMTDIYGGTPFNIASRFYRKNDNICLISGMNLDMVIEYFSSDLYYNTKKFIDEIISVSKDSIALYSKNESEIYADIDI